MMMEKKIVYFWKMKNEKKNYAPYPNVLISHGASWLRVDLQLVSRSILQVLIIWLS